MKLCIEVIIQKKTDEIGRNTMQSQEAGRSGFA